MNRDQQFKNMEGLLTWYDDIMSHYEAAFWVHYQMLNNDIEIWNKAIINDNNPPRVIYFINTEYMSMVYSELLITIETLFKAELSRLEKGAIKFTHKLIELMDEMLVTNDERCISIRNKFSDCIDILSETDDRNAFVNLRYVDYDRFILDSETATKIKKLINRIDEVYTEYYFDFDIARLLYLGMEDSMGDSDLSEGEKRRIKNLDI